MNNTGGDLEKYIEGAKMFNVGNFKIYFSTIFISLY